MELVKRQKYLDDIKAFADKPEIIKVITGMRRSGKSYFLLSLIEEFKKKYKLTKNDWIYINKESADFDHIETYKDLVTFVKKNFSKSKKKKFLFIDEVQDIFEWEKAVKSFFADKNIDIYITGSNASLLSSELSSYLSGRYIEFQIFPLSFKEFLDFRTLDTKPDIKTEFNLFLKYGTLPVIHLLEFDEQNLFQMIKSIYNTILLKDITKRYSVRNVALLESITKFAFDNIGSLISAKSIADYCKSQRLKVGIETVQNYLSYLADSFLFDRVVRYDIQGKRFMEINDKYYARDFGMANAVLGFKDKNIAGLLENIVYVELKRRGFLVSVGKLNSLEVDFVAEKNGVKEYFQVSYLLESDKTKERELKPLLDIKDNYAKYLLTLDDLPDSDFEGVQRMNLINWLLK